MISIEWPACIQKRQHTVREWKEYHPLARHGYNREQGWTSQEAKRLHDLELLERSKTRTE